MKNSIRDYPWGHTEHIPHLLSIPWPAGKPAAELWMGAHPTAPSEINDGGWWKLDEWITVHPERALGKNASKEFGRLPFLFKLLAAGKALSIQAHPDKKTAEEGYLREELAGIHISDPKRNYKDNNHKPEIIMAITPFTAMIGFQKPQNIYKNMAPLCQVAGTCLLSDTVLSGLQTGDQKKLQDFLKSILSTEAAYKQNILNAAEKIASQLDGPWNPLQRKWVQHLSTQFPGDIGAIAPLFLNLVEITPGEALYLPARMLHAYLDGFGVELMANSDNVLRGGLTSKNIDIPELLNILEFHFSEPHILKATDSASGLHFFSTPAREFSLGIVHGNQGKTVHFAAGDGPLIVLILEGTAELRTDHDALIMHRGNSAFIPHDAPHILLNVSGKIAVARLGP